MTSNSVKKKVFKRANIFLQNDLRESIHRVSTCILLLATYKNQCTTPNDRRDRYCIYMMMIILFRFYDTHHKMVFYVIATAMISHCYYLKKNIILMSYRSREYRGDEYYHHYIIHDIYHHARSLRGDGD